MLLVRKYSVGKIESDRLLSSRLRAVDMKMTRTKIIYILIVKISDVVPLLRRELRSVFRKCFQPFFFLERLGKGLAGGLENALAPLACSLSCSLSVSRSPKRSLVFLCLVGVS